jgi:signal peptidase I
VSLRRDSASFVRDNIEAFAVAIAMALVIRHFCIEAFRIPTDSMRPTLYGDEPRLGRHGDRILVDKFAWLVREPRRFEVAVFQYPLNRTKNFIKRILGLPGERLRIYDGDVWIRAEGDAAWRIARKPEGVEDQLFLPFYPRPVDDEEAFQGRRNFDADASWTVDEGARRFRVDADGGGGVLRFRHRIPPYDKAGIGAFRGADETLVGTDRSVGDVRVAFTVVAERAGTLVVTLREHGHEHELRLGARGTRLVADGDETLERELPFRIEAGRRHEVAFANVDGTLVVSLDGETTRVEIPGETEGEPWNLPPRSGGHGVELEAIDFAAEVRDLAIARDVYYTDDGRAREWSVPAGHYMMLGDNSGNSADSRRWTAQIAALVDGSVIRWEAESRDGIANPGPGWKNLPPDARLTVEQDVDGVVRRFRRGDAIDARSGEESLPFVPRDYLIGRAFVVFWPIHVPGIYWGPTRIKLIR